MKGTTHVLWRLRSEALLRPLDYTSPVIQNTSSCFLNCRLQNRRLILSGQSKGRAQDAVEHMTRTETTKSIRLATSLHVADTSGPALGNRASESLPLLLFSLVLALCLALPAIVWVLVRSVPRTPAMFADVKPVIRTRTVRAFAVSCPFVSKLDPGRCHAPNPPNRQIPNHCRD